MQLKHEFKLLKDANLNNSLNFTFTVKMTKINCEINMNINAWLFQQKM